MKGIAETIISSEDTAKEITSELAAGFATKEKKSTSEPGISPPEDKHEVILGENKIRTSGHDLLEPPDYAEEMQPGRATEALSTNIDKHTAALDSSGEPLESPPPANLSARVPSPAAKSKKSKKTPPPVKKSKKGSAPTPAAKSKKITNSTPPPVEKSIKSAAPVSQEKKKSSAPPPIEKSVVHKSKKNRVPVPTEKKSAAPPPVTKERRNVNMAPPPAEKNKRRAPPPPVSKRRSK
uniref:Uncharacterized protein n=1 Tax=Octactis speculum TaxID=3111310 RepID=A0A7S2GZX6_9STRA